MFADRDAISAAARLLATIRGHSARLLRPVAVIYEETATRRTAFRWNHGLLLGVLWLALSNSCGTGMLDPEHRRALETWKEQRREFGEPLASSTTPVRSHEFIPGDSTQRISFRVERTVLVRPLANRPETLFYRIGGLAVDGGENVYVLDNGEATIRVFDRNGRYLRSVGDGPGQGPGQLSEGGRVAVAGRRIYYASGATRRLVVWDINGAEMSTRSMRDSVLEIAGTHDGLVIGSWRSRSDYPYTFHIGNIWDGGGAASLMQRAPYPQHMTPRGSGFHGVTEIPTRSVEFAVDENQIYITKSDAYEVLAIDLRTRQEAWLLRVESPVDPFDNDDRRSVMEALRERVPNAREDLIDWPDHHPALAVRRPGQRALGGADKPIHVDGHARVFVFPFVKDPHAGVPYPVDVFDANGDRIVAGLMPRINWQSASGDFIYGAEVNDDDEVEIVRYRVVIPENPRRN